MIKSLYNLLVNTSTQSVMVSVTKYNSSVGAFLDIIKYADIYLNEEYNYMMFNGERGRSPRN